MISYSDPRFICPSNSKSTGGYFNLETGDSMGAGLIISMWMCRLGNMELAVILHLKGCVSVKRRSSCFHLQLTAKIQFTAALHVEAECQCACLGCCFGIVLTLIWNGLCPQYQVRNLSRLVSGLPLSLLSSQVEESRNSFSSWAFAHLFSRRLSQEPNTKLNITQTTLLNSIR